MRCYAWAALILLGCASPPARLPAAPPPTASAEPSAPAGSGLLLPVDSSGVPVAADGGLDDGALSVPLDVHAAPPSPCPLDMVLVDGAYCPQVDQVCLRWLEYGDFAYYRCAQYQKPAKCKSGRMHLRVCIDREEYVRPEDADSGIPVNQQSWTMSQQTCARQGKRNCEEREWQFACEGEDMHPYPYGDGFTRDATACNIDRDHVSDGKKLLDLRAPITSFPRCLSPFGVHDMSGNVEEWATKDNPPQPPPMRATMKGAWWLPGKNTCRAATVDHDENYRGTQTGIRCCRDPSF